MHIEYLDGLQDDIKSWPKDVQRKYLKIVEKLEQYGLDTLIETGDVIQFRNCEVKLFEFKPKRYRVFFTIIEGTIWAVSEYKKETRSTPLHEKEKAINLIKALNDGR